MCRGGGDGAGDRGEHGWGELGNRARGLVTTVRDLPLVVGSISTQAGSRCSAAGLGKISTTPVRRLTSWFSRSMELVDQILAQCSSGKLAKPVISQSLTR